MQLDFLGDLEATFMKSSLGVYCNASGNRQYVGKTTNEKTVSPNIEVTEWWDNSTGTQTLYVLDIDKFGLSVAFAFMQINPNSFAIGWNGELDTSDPNIDYVFFGSNPAALSSFEWRFAGQARDRRNVILVMRKGICVPNGDWTVGTPGDYTNLPVIVRSLQDTSVANTQRDMAYFMIDKLPNS